MKKILIALDGSKNALKATEYVGEQFGGRTDVKVTLFHVSAGVPPELWDDGHILSEDEKAERRAVLDKWLANRRLKIEPIFREATEALTKRGVAPEQIETKAASETIENIPECILAEAKSGGCQTLVLGRCGLSRTSHALLGSIVTRIINRSAGIAVCVVE